MRNVQVGFSKCERFRAGSCWCHQGFITWCLTQVQLWKRNPVDSSCSDYLHRLNKQKKASGVLRHLGHGSRVLSWIQSRGQLGLEAVYSASEISLEQELDVSCRLHLSLTQSFQQNRMILRRFFSWVLFMLKGKRAGHQKMNMWCTREHLPGFEPSCDIWY